MPPYGYGPPMSPKPGVIPLRPLRLGDIFEGAIATIRGNPGATIGLSLILGLVVTVLVVVGMVGVAQIPTGSDDAATGLTLAVSYGGKFLWAFAGLILTGMLIAVLSEAVLGRRMTIGAAWGRARPRIWSLIGLSVLLFLAAMISLAIVVVLLVVLGMTAGSTPTIIVGVLLGIGWFLGMVFCYVRLSLASAAIVLERIGPIRACKRSWSLTGGQFWRIFGITLLAALVVGFISGVLSGIATLGAEAISLSSTSDADHVLTVTLIVSTITGTLVSALTAPFQANVTGLLYLDQRIRKEGLDVTLMAAADPKASAAR